ncbi:hypothetical protein FIE12Z_11206 [Fusarium flagelliforme]|uniref:Uncharacterized protein n=1 Tax=Fusarium flagelliforme TaxID=2675880 RepID=A0A395M9Q7_9HYPO|nr:hypothetical protein FIE12Z_11206 [Fusarium flagelliforme]
MLTKPKVNQPVQDSNSDSVPGSIADPIESNNKENNDKDEDNGPTGEHRLSFQKWLDDSGNPELLPLVFKRKHSAVETAKEHIAPSTVSYKELRDMPQPKRRKRSALEKLAKDKKRSEKRRQRPKQNKPAEPTPDSGVNTHSEELSTQSPQQNIPAEPKPDSEEYHSPYPVGPLKEASIATPAGNLEV